VLPRFLGASSRDAKEVVAAILPCPAPPRRDVVTVVKPITSASAAADATGCGAQVLTPEPPALAVAAGAAQTTQTPAPLLLAPEENLTRPARDSVEPLTADLRRLGVTVSARFLRKLQAARDGLSHAQPRATTEQVLETALDLLLEHQARRKALVKRPRAAKATPAMASASTRSPATLAAAPSPVRPLACPRAIPAAVEREVRLRDGNRCQYPLDAGGVCGSTVRVQLDHLQPVALGGPPTVANLRCLCATHNRYAAARTLGPASMRLRRPGP
jgi:hypothetical protein